MAKALVNTQQYSDRPKVKRPGVHAKKKSSRLKGSKNYVKPYRGQGR